MKSMRLVGVYASIVCLALRSVVWANEITADTLIQRVEQHYNKARTLTVDFVEDYTIQGRRRPPETGMLTLRKQGKMRWDYSKPAGKLFVSDGKMLYLYTAGDNKVEEIALKDTEDMRAPLAFLLGHLDLKRDFHDFATHPDPGGSWLEAGAKNARTPYEKIEMLVTGSGAISHLIVVGRDTSRLEFALNHEQVNPMVNDSLFAFKIPPGAEVVSAMEYAGER